LHSCLSGQSMYVVSRIFVWVSNPFGRQCSIVQCWLIHKPFELFPLYTVQVLYNKNHV
jgi:hypothetical protein